MRICIDNVDVEYNLTIGKEYEGINDDGQLAVVIDDTGFMETYVVTRFEKKGSKRNEDHGNTCKNNL